MTCCQPINKFCHINKTMHSSLTHFHRTIFLYSYFSISSIFHHQTGNEKLRCTMPCDVLQGERSDNITVLGGILGCCLLCQLPVHGKYHYLLSLIRPLNDVINCTRSPQYCMYGDLQPSTCLPFRTARRTRYYFIMLIVFCFRFRRIRQY